MLQPDETSVTVVRAAQSRDLRLVGSTLAAPAECITLAVVDLPLPRHAQRRQALAFAMEEKVSQPLDALHFALGPRVEGTRFLAAAVDSALMARWAADDRARQAPIVPDVLALPVPDAGHWSVEADGDRVLVRTCDGAGFATRMVNLRLFWERSGRPAIRAAGDPLPDDVPVAERLLLNPLPDRLDATGLDLRQGAFAGSRPTLALTGHWRALAWITGTGFAAHAAVAAADTFALTRIAEARRADVELLVALARPGTYLGDDLLETGTGLLADADRGGGALPLLSRVSAALLPLAGGLTFDSAGYAGEDEPLALVLSAQDRRTFDRAAGLLRDAGFSVRTTMPVPAAQGFRTEMLVEGTL